MIVVGTCQYGCMLCRFSLLWLFVTLMGRSQPGSSPRGIFQARILELPGPPLQGIFLAQGPILRPLCLLHWQVGSSPPAPPGKWTHISIVSVSRSVVPDSFATPWTAAHQARLSMRFSRQGYWSGLPLPSPGDFPNPGIKPRSPALQADSLLTELQGKPTYQYTFVQTHRI